MARQFPQSQVTAVSNSNSQREYIESEARARGLTNLRVITSDMNVFAPDAQFDRIVSVEMFEHMMNWRELMSRVPTWRWFFLATSGLFGYADGSEWSVSHYRMKAVAQL
jgi:cyclopropane-fatty-acyl-phospholipid synthase